MTGKKLFVLVLSTVFLASTVGLAAAQAKPEPTAQEKKGAEESKKVAEPTGKAVGKSKNADGMVKAATANSLTVVGRDKKELTFAVDTKTSIKKAGKAVIASDLKEGDPVHVQFTDADGKLVAKAISVKAGGTAKKEEKMEKK